MKFKIHNGVIDILNLTPEQFDVMLEVVSRVDKHCFDHRNEDGTWLSNDTLTLVLTDSQRSSLAVLCSRIEDLYKF